MPFEVSGRQKVMLAALASTPSEGFAPVQVQKMFFLFDENIHADLGGKQFNFEPYDYGPFDKTVYQELDRLEALGLVRIYQVNPSAGGRRYSLTPAGQLEGQRHLSNLSMKAQDFMSEVGAWVKTLTFAELVGSIYRAFPRMRERSIFIG